MYGSSPCADAWSLSRSRRLATSGCVEFSSYHVAQGFHRSHCMALLTRSGWTSPGLVSPSAAAAITTATDPLRSEMLRAPNAPAPAVDWMCVDFSLPLPDVARTRSLLSDAARP